MFCRRREASRVFAIGFDRLQEAKGERRAREGRSGSSERLDARWRARLRGSSSALARPRAAGSPSPRRVPARQASQLSMTFCRSGKRPPHSPREGRGRPCSTSRDRPETSEWRPCWIGQRTVRLSSFAATTLQCWFSPGPSSPSFSPPATAAPCDERY